MYSEHPLQEDNALQINTEYKSVGNALQSPRDIHLDFNNSKEENSHFQSFDDHNRHKIILVDEKVKLAQDLKTPPTVIGPPSSPRKESIVKDTTPK